MAFLIRELQPADFETLWRIDQDCFPAGISYSRAELKTYMRRRAAFTLVAVDTRGSKAAHADIEKNSPNHSGVDSVVGFIVAEADKRARGHIVTIDVVKDARRFGVGSLLLRAAEDRLHAAACTVVELETAVDNLSALSFYKRHGYNVTGTFPRYYSNGVDALVLQKDLP